MKSKIAALVLALLAGLWAQAHARPALPSEECVHKSFWTPYGSGTAWVRGTSEAAGVRVSWWAWWCPAADGQWVHVIQQCVQGRACLDAEGITRELDTAARSADPLEALRAARARLATPPLPSEQPAWDQATWDAAGELAKIRPQSAPALIVGPATRVDGTRPAYRYVDGKRGSTAVPPGATAGQPCDAGKAFETTSAGTWAPFGPAFAADIGTLCVRP